ncbi:MAG TPA: hypothetical protein VGX76_11890 [Pirellulales bacterium]|jgi:hypothetical protein|nr:hypothetical protein [Pirellulales bacterium]
MPSHDGRSPPAIGFLTVVRHEPHGFFGGYLVLNPNGRPLEFHCTAPVKPNRAQEILYGPTLEPFLYGEQIGRTLVEKSTVGVRLICTDVAPALAMRDHVGPPVVLVLSPDGVTATSSATGEIEHLATAATPALRVDAAHAHGPIPIESSRGRNGLAVAAGHADDRRAVAEVLEALAGHFDLAEPFTRIREAIDEAQRGAK